MSIYIAITALEDLDILGTVATAIRNADSPENVHIGLAAAVSQPFFDHISSELAFDQVTLRHFDPQQANGIGRARNLSRFAYSSEDYVLQVDSHTKFDEGWDGRLIDLYRTALSATRNSKTILTASLGRHDIVGGRAVVYDREAGYCVITPAKWSQYTNINNWLLVPMSQFPPQYRAFDTIIPANKVNGNFIFSNSSFVEYSGLPNSAVYFDEEVIQTINLLEAGFSLAHPNSHLPLTHRYKRDGETPQRQDGKTLFWSDERLHDCMMTASMVDFIYNNPSACERYAKHSRWDVATGLAQPFYIPENFSY